MNIAQEVAAYLIARGAKIMSATYTAAPPFSLAKTFCGLEAYLTNSYHMQFIEADTGEWPAVERTFEHMFYESIRARVQATLVPAEHCKEKFATLDTIDGDGNMVKVRWDHKTAVPAGTVLKIGDEVYGVIQVAKPLKSRLRLILDRPVFGKFSRGTPIYGCGVATNPPFNNFKGVTVVSSPYDDEPGVENQHESSTEGLHFRVTRQSDGETTRCVVESLCGLSVDPTTASLR